MKESMDEFKRKVQESSEIVDVINSYVPLQKKGRSYWACCPFHGEKTPSFSVNREKQFFYCFGCHAGGDVFTFIQKIENCDFKEALKKLADRANIPVPNLYRSPEDIRRNAEKKRLQDVNEIAGRYFSACLEKTPYGARVKEYLHNRGITDEIIQRFSLGASLQSFGSLLSNLRRKGCDPRDLLKAGLVREKNGRLMDAFIGRMMIPIKDPRGRIVGFGGRVIDDKLPKYLNTGETAVFQKRETLFGMDVALKPIRARKLVIVVEGYMDAISLHAAGVDWAVASLGTAFSKEHAKMLARMNVDAVFCYDSDDAGRRNAVRAVTIARENGLPVKVMNVPDGKDPDEYIRKAGQEAFERLVEGARDGVEFQIDYEISKININSEEGKQQAVSNISPYVPRKKQLDFDRYVRYIANELTITEGLIKDWLRQTPSPAARGGQQESVPAGMVPAPERRGIIPPAAVAPPGAAPVSVVDPEEQAELALLKVCFRFPGLIERYAPLVEEAGFRSSVRSGIFNKMRTLIQEGYQEFNGAVFAEEDEETKREIARIQVDSYTLEDDESIGEKAVKDCVSVMLEGRYKAEYNRHRKLADQYLNQGDPAFREELQACMEWKRKIKELYGND